MPEYTDLTASAAIVTPLSQNTISSNQFIQKR